MTMTKPPRRLDLRKEPRNNPHGCATSTNVVANGSKHFLLYVTCSFATGKLYSPSIVQTFHTLQKQSAEHQDPLYRLFFREGSIGSKLLSQVRKDLADVVKVCEGALKQTNHLRTLMSALTKG